MDSKVFKFEIIKECWDWWKIMDSKTYLEKKKEYF